MIGECERCREMKPVQFVGKPSDVDKDKAQNGEWLCADCLHPRLDEMDEAIARMQRYLKETKP